MNEISLRRAWTTRLYAEYDWILMRHGVRLAKPVLEVVDTKSFWGKWDPGSRTIRISTRLIIEYSWDVVINILKHEMAHQIVTDLFRQQTGHGAQFLHACRMLGVPESYQGASGELPAASPARQDKAPEGAGRHLDKARKLLALAQSSNEHEAGLAMQKANQLIEKYNLERIEQRQEGRYTYHIINHKKKRINRTENYICSILVEYFFVEVILSSLYDAVQNETYKTMEVLGTEENVEIAVYVYFFLQRQLESLWRTHQEKNLYPGGLKNSYQLGVLNGFREKLSRQTRERNPSGPRKNGREISLSLMVCGQDAKLHAFVNDRFPRLSQRRSRAIHIDPNVYEAGRRDGGELTLHRGIRDQGEAGGMLPEG